MKRELLFFLLLFIFLGSVIYASDPDVISPNIPPTKNQTHLEIQYFPQGNNQFLFSLNLYQIVTRKEKYDDIYEMLTPQDFFNRDFVEDGLTIFVKSNGDIIGLCQTLNSKCDIQFDLNDFNVFSKDESCFKVYGEFGETDFLRGYQTSDILICRDKNIMVGEAFKDALDILDGDLESQHVCILFFVFMGFLISALYASGGNPLRYFDITTPRLPKAKAKIKIDVNTKENEIRKGRRDVRQIKKNLIKTQKALFKALEETALKVLRKKYEKIGEKRGWNESKIYVTYMSALKKYIDGVKKEFEKMSREFEKEIDSKLKDKEGMEAVTLEVDLRKEKTDKLIGFMESKLKLEDFSDEFKEKQLDEFRQKQLEEYRTNYLNFHSAEMAVNMRSNLMRGAVGTKRIGGVRKFVESLPVISSISISAEALFRKRGSLEIKTAEYAGIKAYEALRHHSGKKRARKMFREIENDGFYNKFTIVPENETLEQKIKREGKLKELELIKGDLDKYKEELEEFSDSENYEEHKNELLATIVKEKLKESDENLGSIKENFIQELEELVHSEDISEENKKYLQKLIKIYSAKKINFKKLDGEFENNIKGVLTDIEIERGEDEAKEKTNKLINSHKLFVEEIALNEELKEDDKKLSLFQTSSAILKPDTTTNNITALYYSKNLLRELENVPCKYIAKSIKESIKEKNKEDKEELKKSLEEFSLDYGKLVRDYNPKERYPHLVKLAEKYKLNEKIIKKADNIFNDVSKLKIETTSEGFIDGASEVVDYFDGLKEKEDFLELGIFDTMQDPREIFASYLEVYSAYDSNIGDEQEKISKVLTEQGFEKAIDIVEGMSFSSKEIDRLFPKTYHDLRSQERVKKELKDYLPYVIFSEEFDDSLNLFKDHMERKHNQKIEFDEERINKVREFYAEFMSENYKDNNVGLSSEMFNKNKSELSENEIKFMERAEVIFTVASNALVPDSEHKDELMDFYKINLDLSEKNMKEKIKAIDIDNNKYVMEKWKEHASRHRAEAIRMPVLQQNIFKLRDYVESSVSTYDKLFNIATELNNEKKDKILMMNLYLGGIVKNSSELSGQQIFTELSSTVTGVLGSSYDKYFREIYEKSRKEILKEALIEDSAIKIAREEFFQKISLNLIKKQLSKRNFLKLEALNYIKEELGKKVTKEDAKNILEGNFDEVRESLSLDSTFDDKKMEEIKSKLSSLNEIDLSIVYDFIDGDEEIVREDLSLNSDELSSSEIKELQSKLSKLNKIEKETINDLIEGNFDKVRESLSLDSNEYTNEKLREVKSKISSYEINSQVIYDLLDGKFDKIRKNLGLDKKVFTDRKMKSLQVKVYGSTNQEMYRRINHRGWEVHEKAIFNKLKKTIPNINIYDMYDLLDGNYNVIQEKYMISPDELDSLRKELLEGNEDTYALMKDKGVEFLVGGNNPENLQEVYYLFKAQDKFRKDKDDKLLEEIIKQELDKRGLENTDFICKKVNNFFKDTLKNGLILPGLEITAEAETRYAWHIDIKSNYIPLYQLGDKKRAFKNIVETFSSILDGRDIEFENTMERERYLKRLKTELEKYDDLSIDEILNQIGEQSSIVLAKNIKNHKIFFSVYEKQSDYEPSYKIQSITGKVTNVKAPQMMLQEDGTYRSVLAATDEFMKMRKFGYKVTREINKYFVKYPMIGYMSESLSTFNTMFRSKDYFSKSLSNYSSFQTTKINDLTRNAYVVKFLKDLYLDKWTYSEMISSDEEVEIDLKKYDEKLTAISDKLLLSMKEQIKNYFELKGEEPFFKDDFDENKFNEMIQQKRNELNEIIESSDYVKSYLAQVELDKLNEEFEKFEENAARLIQVKKMKDNLLKNISSAVEKNSADDLENSYDEIIEAFVPYAGEYDLKYNLEMEIMRKGFQERYREERIEDYEKEMKLISKFEKKSIKEINSLFSENLVNASLAIGFLEDFLSDTSNKKLEDIEFAKKKLAQLLSIKESREDYKKEIKTLEKEKKYFSYLTKNKDDWKEIVDRHSEKAKKLNKNDIKMDKLFATGSVLFEHFSNSYESLYKTRNLSIHTRKAAFGFPGNEYGGTQFAGPISSTPLQYHGTMGSTGGEGWFASSFLSSALLKTNKMYHDRYALNYMINDVPSITSPMGLSSRFSLVNYFKMKYGMGRDRFGEYLNPLPEGKTPLNRDLVVSLFSKNIRGERRITEMLDFLGGSYRGTPGGARDVYNYLAFKPNELMMDFKDKIFTYKDARSMKKASEFLYDIGFYAPFTNNRFIAGREISLFTDAYYGEMSAPSTFYPNRAMNLLSSAPHYSNSKYRGMAYSNYYKLSQSQAEMVSEVIAYTNMGKKPAWYPLSIPFIPLILGTAGLPFFAAVSGFVATSGLGSGLISKYKEHKYTSKLKSMPLDNYLDEKYGFYYKKGLYSDAYASMASNNNNNNNGFKSS